MPTGDIAASNSTAVSNVPAPSSGRGALLNAMTMAPS